MGASFERFRSTARVRNNFLTGVTAAVCASDCGCESVCGRDGGGGATAVEGESIAPLLLDEPVIEELLVALPVQLPLPSVLLLPLPLPLDLEEDDSVGEDRDLCLSEKLPDELESEGLL